MQAKNYLQKAYKIDMDIICKTAQMEGIQKLINMTMKVWEPYASRHCFEMSSLQKNIVKLAFMEKEKSEEIGELISIRTEVEATINRLEDSTLKNILKLRYVESKSWSQIAEILNCDQRWIYRLHVKGLNAMDKILREYDLVRVS